MFGKLTLAAGLIAAATAFAPISASAVTLAPQSGAVARTDGDSLVVQVKHRRHHHRHRHHGHRHVHVHRYGGGSCSFWRRECADRWGWRSGGWYRCVARHGCHS